MLGNLVIKYIVHNRRKILVAILLLTISLSMIISSRILIDSYSSEINRITSSGLVFDSQIDVTIKPEETHTFSSSQYAELSEFLVNRMDIDTIYVNYIEVIQVQQEQKLEIYELRISNIQELVDEDRLEIPDITEAYNVYFRSLLYEEIVGYSNLEFLLDGNFATIDVNQSGQFSDNSGYIADILIDSNSPVIPASINNTWNNIEIQIKDNVDEAALVKELEKFTDISVQYKRADAEFIEISVDQIKKLMNILQTVLGVLLILSISYIMINIIEDSAQDIKILHLVGTPKRVIFLLFQAQSVVISVIAYALAFLLSLLTLNILLPLVSLLAGLPYIPINVDYGGQILILLFSLIIGVLSGIIPSLKVVK